jgi:membrane protein YqaA with SNARE-associated domain
MAGDPAAAVEPAAQPRNPLRRLYQWILSWAHHPLGTLALAVFSFLDSFIFPIPPLFLQVALSLERPRRSFWYAFVDTSASVLGSVVGYVIGVYLYDSVGDWVIRTWHMERAFATAGEAFGRNAFGFILVYSFLPFPYKVITIASGVFHGSVSLPTLLLASTLGRGWRFFGLAALCFFWGTRVRSLIERYFNWVCLGIGALVAAVLAALKFAPQLLGK